MNRSALRFALISAPFVVLLGAALALDNGLLGFVAVVGWLAAVMGGGP